MAFLDTSWRWQHTQQGPKYHRETISDQFDGILFLEKKKKKKMRGYKGVVPVCVCVCVCVCLCVCACVCVCESE